MNYLLASLLVVILFLMLMEKRKIDRVYALLNKFDEERLIEKRKEELEALLKQFAAK